MAECIEREALLAHLRKCKETSTGSGLTAAVITAIQSFVEEMPLADVAPVVHGEWKFAFEFNNYNFYYCSACGRLDFLLKNHESHDMNAQCPYCHCGAKMDGKGEDA